MNRRACSRLLSVSATIGALISCQAPAPSGSPGRESVSPQASQGDRASAVAIEGRFQANGAPDADQQPVEGWLLGAVSGVTPENYEVEVEGHQVRLRGNGKPGYQSLCRTHEFGEEDRGLMVASYTMQQRLHTEGAMPMVWLRVDGEDGMISMTDSRENGPRGSGSWESVTVKAAVPGDAVALTFGMALLGGGEVEYQDYALAVVDVADAQPPSPEAAEYLETAIQWMESEAMNRDQVDWDRVRVEARGLAGGASAPSDTHIAIRHALGALGDHHSHLIPASSNSARAGTGGSSATAAGPTGRSLQDGIGYIQLPSHSAGSKQRDQAYADKGAEILSSFGERPRGVVIDLRRNGGGTMWPMLAAVGPLLGAERVGTFVYHHSGERQDWIWRDGMIHCSGVESIGPKELPGVTWPGDMPVALLYSRRTGSAGEAVAIAFRGRPKTRSFGVPTNGLSTNNGSYRMPDGSLLQITNGVYADRTSKEYGQAIEPDVRIEPNETVEGADEDTALAAAVAWLMEQ